jgi:hypothetical protein
MIEKYSRTDRINQKGKRMDDYLTIFATLLGAIIGGIIGFVSAYLVQRQLFKREHITEMRDEIYGPMLMEINDILEATKAFEYLDPTRLVSLKGRMKDYLFLTYAKPDLRNSLFELIDRIDKYDLLKIAAQELFNDFTQKELKKNFPEYMLTNSYQISFRLLKGSIIVKIIYLQQAVFLKANLKDFVEAGKEKWGKDITVEALIGVEAVPKDFELLYNNVSQEMEKEPLYLEERTQRIKLMAELEHSMEKLKVLVKS